MHVAMDCGKSNGACKGPQLEASIVWSSYEELWEATAGFTSRLDADGSLSGSYLGSLPDQASEVDGSREEFVVVRALQWVPPDQALQRGHAQRLAELAHPHLLPLLGVCEQPRHAVYALMPV